MAGHDAVVTCLGYSGPKYDKIWFKEVTIYTDFIEPVITAMKAAKVKRLVVLSSWGTTGKLTCLASGFGRGALGLDEGMGEGIPCSAAVVAEILWEGSPTSV